MQRTMGTTSYVITWATERRVAHTAPVGCRVAHLPVVAGRTFRTMGIATGSVPLRVTHTQEPLNALQVPA